MQAAIVSLRQSRRPPRAELLLPEFTIINFLLFVNHDALLNFVGGHHELNFLGVPDSVMERLRSNMIKLSHLSGLHRNRCPACAGIRIETISLTFF
jgi:hypothetical protein